MLAERSAGVRLVFAEGFERIYRQNADNVGLFTSTDFALLARLERGEPITLDELLAGRDALAAAILRHGGLLRYEDMAAFRVQPEEPASTTFQGYTVYKPGFWSQGPAMLETLNILEPYDLRAMQRNSADYVHTLVEALKLAYADRDTWYGDP
jgi:hypothetical protein